MGQGRWRQGMGKGQLKQASQPEMPGEAHDLRRLRTLPHPHLEAREPNTIVIFNAHSRCWSANPPLRSKERLLFRRHGPTAHHRTGS